MSQLEILPAPRPIDLVSAPRLSSVFHHHPTTWTQNKSLLTGKSVSVNGDDLGDNDIGDDGDTIFPGLPPLLRGHPEVHLRNGVIRAARLSATNEPDSESAFFVADLSSVYNQLERWRRYLPEIEPFYAVKCNPDPYVLRLLAALGTGFDCASNGEIGQVLRLGVSPDRIIYANPCKAVSSIKSAARTGVDAMTFDNEDELYKVARVNPNAKLVLRILTDDSKSLCRLGLKFGAPLVTVPGLLLKAKELGLDVIGISFHVGSGCYDSSAFTDAVGWARAAFDMGLTVGYKFSFLDVGGGFEDTNFETTASVLCDALDLHFPDRSGSGLRIIAEPGRYFVSRAFSLAANIIARRAPLSVVGETTEIKGEGDDQPSMMYYINDGVYGAFNCILFDHQEVHPYVLTMNGSFHFSGTESLQASSVWGPTCDSIDCVCPMARLPAGLRVGDWLAFNNMGAYTICAASQFNGFAVSLVTYTSGDGYGSQEVRLALKAAHAAVLNA
ncbi:pyridoxal-dependent decarboxylase [Multifurca ochricompacta]|uniref:ornithine decarboxylase n=1 Tax=Multifurca ochricompacta TaxID=376703 RepID=A0AAD4QJI5_9AGAM|nr:pyridoxal-dependent decarboxylase [Multifurca ochricompacta]